MSTQKNVSTITIIVPVYKAEAYLKSCVDSILAQNFHDYELLLIDDGSPDECGILCDQYAAQDARVRVIHKENGGVSSARNAGMDAAGGKYIVFIDSDDYVGPGYLEALLAVEADEKTLVISDYCPFRESGEELREYPEGFCTELDSGSADPEDFRKLVFGFRVFPPYCKLYQRNVIEESNLRFNTELRTAEDFDFNMCYLQKMERVCYIPSVQYYYRVGYKPYVPSNGGVLGDSEIKSVHTMASGITALAKRMGVYDVLEEEICLWAAKKHYFNRMPMLFATNPEIGYGARRRLYRKLTADPNYRRLHKQGIRAAENCTTKQIGKWFDWFPVWWIFYRLNSLRRENG